jgi:hypothetical protein
VYILLYVDDILIAGKSRSAIDDVKAMLKSEFEMKDLGAAKRLLGMDIRRDWFWVDFISHRVSILRRFYITFTCHWQCQFLLIWQHILNCLFHQSL